MHVCFLQEWVDAVSLDGGASMLAPLPHSPPPLITRSSSGSQSPADAGAGPQCPPVEAPTQSSSPDSTDSTGAVLPAEDEENLKEKKTEVHGAIEDSELSPSSSSSRSSRRPRSAVSSWNFSGNVPSNVENGSSSSSGKGGLSSSSSSVKNSGSSISGAGSSSTSNNGRTSSVGRKTVTFESYPVEAPRQQQLTLEAAALGGSADAQYAMGTNCADGE